jgi:hypothetical protein
VLDRGVPSAYTALGAYFHLERCAKEDEERLDRACQLVWDWIGPHLRWSYLSSFDGVNPIRRADLDYVSGYVSDLDEPRVPGGDAATQIVVANLAKLPRMEHEVFCHGAEEATAASPFTFGFWAEIPEVGRGRAYQPYAVLFLTVPQSWPIDDFAARACAIAGELRLRWGNAGLTYASFEHSDYEVARRGIYAHARRYPGYDVGEFARHLELFHDRIRSINWLTFVGPALEAKLVKKGRLLETSSLVSVGRLPSCVVLRAGLGPEAGDVNRHAYPPAYVEADTLVGPIRAATGKGTAFLGPWDEDATTDWLRRFERRVS